MKKVPAARRAENTARRRRALNRSIIKPRMGEKMV